MTTTNEVKEIYDGLEALGDRRHFFSLPLETRLRNTCPSCGCRFIDDDYARAIEFVLGPKKLGQCRKCGWVGTK
jgi:hypothetical protein